MKKPKTQLSETLYYLLNRDSINRKQMLFDTGILNLTARISDLRGLNLDINCVKIKTTNKFERKIEYGKWLLADKKKGLQIYNEINND